MIKKKEDNIRNGSFCPDSKFYLDLDNTTKETQLSEDRISNTPIFEWPNNYWFIAEGINGRPAMIGFMTVIINNSLFGWIAYPFLLMGNSNFDKNGVDKSGTNWLKYAAFVLTAFAIYFVSAFFNDDNVHLLVEKIIVLEL